MWRIFVNTEFCMWNDSAVLFPDTPIATTQPDSLWIIKTGSFIFFKSPLQSVFEKKWTQSIFAFAELVKHRIWFQSNNSLLHIVLYFEPYFPIYLATSSPPIKNPGITNFDKFDSIITWLGHQQVCRNRYSTTFGLIFRSFFCDKQYNVCCALTVLIIGIPTFLGWVANHNKFNWRVLSILSPKLPHNEQLLLQVGYFMTSVRYCCPIENIKLESTTKSQ